MRGFLFARNTANFAFSWSKSSKKLERLGEAMKSVEKYGDSKNKFIKKIDYILMSEYNQYTKAGLALADLGMELTKYNN